ncbi:unnamed protein product [Blepharisma stoltei]|uniref:Uncharacterized protein n=1 Tax=Blepharisma stoltei TaxID=1481888 RepID=A0AAU9JEJ5_9CILI|nr:unnamed protein product [Blepharisma stoltei]
MWSAQFNHTSASSGKSQKLGKNALFSEKSCWEKLLVVLEQNKRCFCTSLSSDYKMWSAQFNHIAASSGKSQKPW